MNYLTRPVFTWPIDWSAAITRSISYDLRQTSLGFGAEFYVATQTYSAQGWNFTVELTKPSDIGDVWLFTAALSGRLHGFWLPVPFETMRIVSGISATQFNIAKCNLMATWQDRPDIHLWFCAPDGSNPQAAAITAVVDNGDGTERVTINTPLNPAPTPALVVRRLHYVRLMDDAEKGKFTAEGWLDVQMSVIELPLEYANVETGRQPIYLYHLWSDAPVMIDWYYTSFAVDVWSNGVQFEAFPMSHGQLQQTARGDKFELEIDAKPDVDHPFSLFFPAPFPAKLNVEVRQCTLADQDTTTLVFVGIVRSVEDKGTEYAASCSSDLYLLDRKGPVMQIQPTCNYSLFDLPTCGVLRPKYEITVILTAIHNDPANGPSVVVQLAYADLNPIRTATKDWFAQGIFETGYGINFEPRTITGSSWDAAHSLLTLNLNLPLWKAQVGSYVQITAGCNGLPGTCDKKFNNFARFGGHLAVPQRNLTLEAFDNLPTSQGGKK